jgi:hypothetical protein
MKPAFLRDFFIFTTCTLGIRQMLFENKIVGKNENKNGPLNTSQGCLSAFGQKANARTVVRFEWYLRVPLVHSRDVGLRFLQVYKTKYHLAENAMARVCFGDESRVRANMHMVES